MALFDSLLVGQYIPTGSFLHSLRPEIKIVALSVVVILIFVSRSPYVFLLLGLILMWLLVLSRLKLVFILRGLKPFLVVFLLTFLINLFANEGEVIWKFAGLEATREGLISGLRVLTRLFLLVLFTTLMTLSTSPIEIADGIEHILAPMRLLRFPVHEFALMMTIALRFIPTLVEELEKIMKAQKARGASFSGNSLIGRVRAFLPILVPLFLITFKRADELAVAMEARCYRGGMNRTRMDERKMRWSDFFALFFVAVMAVFLLLVEMSWK